MTLYFIPKQIPYNSVYILRQFSVFDSDSVTLNVRYSLNLSQSKRIEVGRVYFNNLTQSQRVLVKKNKKTFVI